MAQVSALYFDPSYPGIIWIIDGPTGTALPYTVGSLWPVWDTENGQLTIQRGKNDFSPIMRQTAWASVYISNTGSAVSAPGSFAALIDFVAKYIMPEAGANSGNSAYSGILTYNNGQHVPIGNTATAYAAQSIVGGVMIFQANNNGSGPVAGKLLSVYLSDTSGQNANYNLLLFNAMPQIGTYNDNNSFIMNQGDRQQLQQHVTIKGYNVVSSNPPEYAYVQINDLDADLSCDGNGQIYAILVTATGSTPHYTDAACLWLELGLQIA